MSRLSAPVWKPSATNVARSWLERLQKRRRHGAYILARAVLGKGKLSGFSDQGQGAKCRGRLLRLHHGSEPNSGLDRGRPRRSLVVCSPTQRKGLEQQR